MKKSSLAIGLCLVLLGTFSYAAPGKAIKSAVSKVTPKHKKDHKYYNKKIKESFQSGDKARFNKKLHKFKEKGGNLPRLSRGLHMLNSSRAKDFLSEPPKIPKIKLSPTPKIKGILKSSEKSAKSAKKVTFEGVEK